MTSNLAEALRLVLVTDDALIGGRDLVSLCLAAERGGNCELTRADEIVVKHGVTILGPTDLPSTVPFHASQMYAKNVVTFIHELTKDGAMALNMENEVHRDTLLTQSGAVVNARVKDLLGAGS